jgi:hypothetical protein
MRALVGIVLLACTGCPGGSGGECTVDPDCASGAVCARNGECLPQSQIRSVRVTWTIRGMPASETTCAASPDLYLMFAGTSANDTFGYAPVPCKAGLFTIDKLPRRFVSVELGVVNGYSDAQAIDANGNVAFDLYR